MTTPKTPTGSRRRSSNDLWSASSTAEWLGAGNKALGRTPDTATAPQDAVKAKVHYRHRGKSKKPTFTGSDLVHQVAAFQALLAAASAHNWPADDQGAR